jgi:hypothetical protein
MTTHTLSWHVRKTTFREVKPPWWAFWRKPQVTSSHHWERRVVTLLPEEAEAAQRLFSGTMMHPECRVLTTIMSADSLTGELCGLQLVSDDSPTPYFRTGVDDVQ